MQKDSFQICLFTLLSHSLWQQSKPLDGNFIRTLNRNDIYSSN